MATIRFYETVDHNNDPYSVDWDAHVKPVAGWPDADRQDRQDLYEVFIDGAAAHADAGDLLFISGRRRQLSPSQNRNGRVEAAPPLSGAEYSEAGLIAQVHPRIIASVGYSREAANARDMMAWLSVHSTLNQAGPNGEAVIVGLRDIIRPSWIEELERDDVRVLGMTVSAPLAVLTGRRAGLIRNRSELRGHKSYLEATVTIEAVRKRRKVDTMEDKESEDLYALLEVARDVAEAGDDLNFGRIDIVSDEGRKQVYLSEAYVTSRAEFSTGAGLDKRAALAQLHDAFRGKRDKGEFSGVLAGN